MIQSCLMTTTDFPKWIEEKLQERGWRPADLAFAAKIPAGTLSHILNSSRGVGHEVCLAIAHALHERPEEVFRVAGLLPSEGSSDLEDRLSQRLSEIFELLNEDDQELLMAMAEKLLQAKRLQGAREVRIGSETAT